MESAFVRSIITIQTIAALSATRLVNSVLAPHLWIADHIMLWTMIRYFPAILSVQCVVALIWRIALSGKIGIL